MFSDLRTLIWLRIRHMRTAFSRMMHFAGTDPVDSEQLGDRVYQFYIVAFVLIALVLLWAAFLDTVGTVFADMDASSVITVFQGALMVPVILFVVGGLRALRSTPLKFSHADITYVASSSFDSRALVLIRTLWAQCASALIAALVGYALGVALCSGLGVGSNPLVVSVVGALSTAAVVGGVWAIGMLRLVFRRKWLVCAVVCALVLVAIGTGLVGVIAVFATPATFFLPECLTLFCGIVAAVLLGTLPFVTALASRINMTAAIEESALFADLQPLNSFSVIDQNAIRDYRRRKKIARRTTRFRLSAGVGRRAVVAHATLSLLRQPEGLAPLFGHGVGIVPFAAFALLGTGGPVTMLFLLASLMMMPYGVREMTRVFRDDVRNRLIRDRLPFGSLELLVLNTLPTLVIVSMLSLATTVLMVCAGAMSVWGIPLALLLNIALVLSSGLDVVAPEGILGHILCFEAGAVVLVSVVGITSLIGIAAPLSLVATGLVCLVFARLICFGKESIR